MKKIGNKKKLNRSLGGNITIFIILLIFGVFMALPLIFTISSAFKPLDEIFIFPPRFFVSHPTLNNFTMLFQLASNMWVPFSRYLFNSLFVSIVGTVGHVIIASMAAYPLAKHRFPGSKFLSAIILLALLFTPQVTWIPQYIVMSKLKLINTYGALIFPVLQMSLGLYLMQKFMSQVPDALLEAGKIDGAGEFRIFWQIVMPQVKPAWLTLTIFAFQNIWNQKGSSFIYNESLKVLPTILNQITSGGIARAGVGAAVALILLIPPLVLFVLTQSYVIETMTTSGIK